MDFWQWLSLITGTIGVVAFLMATPSLFHIWGKLNIKITFDSARGYRLTCWIRNMPVNRVLASLNVVRTQVVIIPTISIADNEGTLLHFFPYAQHQSDDIRLVVAEVTIPTNLVYLKDVQGNASRDTLGIGLYNLTVELCGSDGRRLKRQESQLRINAAIPYIELVNR